MKLHRKYGFLFIFLILMIVSYVYFSAQQKKYNSITSFESCASKGFFVTTTYPEKCIIPGKIFVNETQKNQEVQEETSMTIENSFKNLSYMLDGEKILFYNGIGIISSQTPSKRNATTTLVITETQGSFDINADFSPDIVFLIKKNSGNAALDEYYIASAVTLNTGYSGVNILYLDTSIASSTIVYKDTIITVEYLDSHTLRKSKRFIFRNGILEEVLKPSNNAQSNS